MWPIIKRLIFRYLAKFFARDDATKEADKRNEQVQKDLASGDSSALTAHASDDLDALERRLRDG